MKQGIKKKAVIGFLTLADIVLSDLDWNPFYNTIIEGNGSVLHIFSNTTERASIYEDEEFVYDRAYALLTGTCRQR